MNLGKLKFEKINMKIVIGIGIALIALITAAFIVFRTNLIIKHKDEDDNTKTSTEQNGNGSSNQSGENGDNGNSGEEDPTNPGSSGNSGNSGNSGSSGNSGNTNTGTQEPNYDDPEEDEEGEVSNSVKKRTKKEEDLTVDEKQYILKDNVTKVVKKDKGMQKNCVKDSFCVLEVKKYTTYSSDEEIGKKITGCSGHIIFYYDSEEKEVVYDMQDVKCK